MLKVHRAGPPANHRCTGARRTLALDSAGTRRTVTGMFAAHHGRHVADKDHPGRGNTSKNARESRGDGFSGLEGDFEEERRRAASAEREPESEPEPEPEPEPADHDGVTRPTLPGSAPGLTHPA